MSFIREVWSCLKLERLLQTPRIALFVRSSVTKFQLHHRHMHQGQGPVIIDVLVSKMQACSIKEYVYRYFFISIYSGPFLSDSEWIFFWCLMQSIFCMNVLGHWLQEYFFSPVWIFWCVLNTSLLVKHLAHCSQERTLGAKWFFWCVLSIPDICNFFYTGSIFKFQILHPKID